jgi:protein-S-isoprenylcysteine O-methyltransferase Ste14
MSLIFIFTCLVWLFTEIALNRFFRSKNTDKKGTDKNTLLLIWIVIIVSIFAAVYIRAKFSLLILSNPTIKYVGLGIIWLGILLRLIVIISLGKSFTVDVTIRQNHQLKKDGFYKYLRHPSYLASLLSFIGLGIALNNWISLCLITLAILAIFVVRIRIEEKALLDQFGSEYAEYKKGTYALIPFIY